MGLEIYVPRQFQKGKNTIEDKQHTSISRSLNLQITTKHIHGNKIQT